MNTTSTGLELSSGFLVPLTAFVPAATARAGEFVATALVVAVPPVLVGPGLITRVVTLAIGTASTLVRVRVSMVAVTDMPGRNAASSEKRMRTENWVADWPEEPEPPPLKPPRLEPESNPSEELPTAVTRPLNFLSL